MIRRLWQSLAVALILLAAWPRSAAASSAPQVWLSGVDPYVRAHQDPGTRSDYTDLFMPTAAWGQAAPHVQVFKTSTQWIIHASDAQLSAMFTELKRRGIALAVEGMLQQ